MAGVQADAQALGAAAGLDQRRELLKGAAQRPARSRGVLEVKFAVVGRLERLGDHLAGADNRLADVAGLGRPGVEDHAGGADVVPDGQRLGQ